VHWGSGQPEFQDITALDMQFLPKWIGYTDRPWFE